MFQMCVAWIAAAVGVLAPSLACAAAIEPPSAFLFNSSHSIVAAEVVRVTGDGGLELRVDKTLHGAPPQAPELRLRTPVQWLAGFEPGQRVLAAYTLYRRSSTRPRALEPRPEGAVLLVSAGLEPALFHDTPPMRALMTVRPSPASAPTRATLDVVMTGLRSRDPQLQNFHAAELELREPLHKLLSDRDRTTIARIAGDGKAHPSARAALLVVAIAYPERFGAQWPGDAALAIVSTSSVTEADATLSLLPNLIRTAFAVLERSHRRIPLASVKRWLPSAQVGLAEAALLAIRRAAPEHERPLIEATLARRDLTPASREFLRDHLRRLAIMHDALEASHRSDKRRD